MNNQVKVNQIALILMLIVSGGKYMSLPQTLSQQVGRDAWLVTAILLAADLLCLAMLVWAVKLNKSKLSFNQTLNHCVGKVVAKAILIVFAIFMAVRLATLYSGVYELFVATFGIRTNWAGFALPLATLVCFALSKGMQPLARTNQLLSAIIAVSLIAILILPSRQANLSELLPVGQSGAGKIATCALKNGFWFSDYVFLYFVLDGIHVKKRTFLPILGFFGIGATLTVFMYVLFTGLFGNMAQYTDLAMSKVSQFVVTSAVNGRIDWLFVTIWTLSVFIKISVFTFSLYKCLTYLFQYNRCKFNLPLGLVATSAILLPLFVTVKHLSQIVTNYLRYPFYVVQYLLPLTMPLLVKVANVKNKTKQEKTQCQAKTNT